MLCLTQYLNHLLNISFKTIVFKMMYPWPLSDPFSLLKFLCFLQVLFANCVLVCLEFIEFGELVKSLKFSQFCLKTSWSILYLFQTLPIPHPNINYQLRLVKNIQFVNQSCVSIVLEFLLHSIQKNQNNLKIWFKRIQRKFPLQSQFGTKVSWPVLLWCVLLTIYNSHIIPELFIICSILCWHHKLFQNSSWFWAHIFFTTWLTKFAYVTKSQWRQECFAT